MVLEESVLDKVLHNFRKRRQRSIVERNIGLEYALVHNLCLIPSLAIHWQFKEIIFLSWKLLKLHN